MRRQFVVVYVVLAMISLFFGTILFVGLAREVDHQVETRMIETLEGPVNRLRERLRRSEHHPPPFRDRIIREFEEALAMEAEVVRLDEAPLDPRQAELLAEGALVAVVHEEHKFVVAQLGPDHLVAMGPISPAAPGRRAMGLVFILSIMLGFIGFVIWILLHPIEKRLRRLSQAADSLGNGELDVRVADKRRDSIGVLGRSFDSMAERIEELIEQQRELLRAVSHELRTPMARAYLVLDEVLEADTEAGRAKQVERLERALADMKEVLEEVTTYNRLEGPGGHDEQVEVPMQRIFDTLPELGRELRPDIRLVVPATNASVWGERTQVKRAIVNLVTNALRHAEREVRITMARRGDATCVHVDDDGPGVPEDKRLAIFEPFSRLDAARTAGIGGLGLGLALVKRIMDRTGGSVEVSESPAGGARFTLVFGRAVG